MQNSNADVYRTVRNADPDADAGSVVRCGTAPYYGTGARADARIRTSVRIRVSILKPGTASFLKLKCKKTYTVPLKGGADPFFF